MNNTPHNIVYRDILFYKKYTYCLRMSFSFINGEPLYKIRRTLQQIFRLESNDVEYTTRFENNGVSFFTNDIDFVNRIKNNEYVKLNVYHHDVEKAVVPTMGIKYLSKEPKYKYRVMFKKYCMFNESIYNFVENNKEYIKINTGLEHHIYMHESFHTRYNSMYKTCYIDTNEETLIPTMLMQFDDYISKVYQLEKMPET